MFWYRYLFFCPGRFGSKFLPIFCSFWTYLHAAGAFLAWLGRGGCAAAFTGVWCSHLASQIARKHPKPAHAAIKLTDAIKTITYCRKYKIVLRVLDKTIYCAGDQESDMRTIGFTFRMACVCGAAQSSQCLIRRKENNDIRFNPLATQT